MGLYTELLLESLNQLVTSGHTGNCKTEEHNLEFELMNILNSKAGLNRITDRRVKTHSCCRGPKSKHHQWPCRQYLSGTSVCFDDPVNINFEIDIIAEPASPDRRIGIELKRIYHTPSTNLFSSCNYSYIYGISPELDYSLSANPLRPDSNAPLTWRGGPLLDEGTTKHYSYFQEGQIWWDIARLLELNRICDTETYSVGFVSQLVNQTNPSAIEVMKNIENVVKFFNKKNESPIFNCHNNSKLQKFHSNSFNYCIIPCIPAPGSNPLQLILAYMIEITN